MKKLAAIFAAAGMLFSLDASAASVTIINGTTSEISEIYISSSDVDDWEENIIEGYVLPSGNQMKIKIPSYKQFDLKIVGTEGGEEDYREFPGNVTSITLEGEGHSTYK